MRLKDEILKQKREKLSILQSMEKTDDLVFELNKQHLITELTNGIKELENKSKVMKKKTLPSFYVLTWDPNRREVQKYDIIPYLMDCYNSQHGKKRNGILIHNDEELRRFIHDKSMYQWWARCEYEIIVVSWPYREEDPMKESEKIDVHYQVEMNLDTIVNIFKTIIKYDV